MYLRFTSILVKEEEEKNLAYRCYTAFGDRDVGFTWCQPGVIILSKLLAFMFKKVYPFSDFNIEITSFSPLDHTNVRGQQSFSPIAASKSSVPHSVCDRNKSFTRWSNFHSIILFPINPHMNPNSSTLECLGHLVCHLQSVYM